MALIAAAMAALCGPRQVALAAVDAEAHKSLHYGFETGRPYVYELRIVAELPNSREVCSGHSFYHVKAVDAQTGQMTLVNTGSASLRRETRTNRPPLAGPPRGPRAADGSRHSGSREFTIDRLGNVVRFQGESKTPMAFGGEAQLPYLLGEFWQLALEPLSPQGESSWQVERQVVISVQGDDFPVPTPFRSREVNRPASKTIQCKIQEINGRAATIRKQYTLATQDAKDGKPVLAMTGEGSLTFDFEARAIGSVDMKYVLEVQTETDAVKVPVSVSVKLLEQAEAERLVQEREAALAAAREKAQAMRERVKQSRASSQPKEEQDAEALARQLLSLPGRASASKALKAMGAKAESAVLPLLEHDDWRVRLEAVKVLAVVGTQQSVGPLDAVQKRSRGVLATETQKALETIRSRLAPPPEN
jgi:hypothetical protein